MTLIHAILTTIASFVARAVGVAVLWLVGAVLFMGIAAFYFLITVWAPAAANWG